MGGEGRLAFCLEFAKLEKCCQGHCVSTNLLPVVGCLTGKYTLKDVVFEAVICFDCRNERKEEGGFLLNR